MSKQLRKVAKSFLTELGLLSSPIDMFEIARDCDFDIYAAAPGMYPRMVGDKIILVDVMQPRAHQQHQVAYALARWALFRAGMDYTKQGAEFIAQALLAGRVPGASRARTPPTQGARARHGSSAKVVIVPRGRGRNSGGRHTTDEAVGAA